MPASELFALEEQPRLLAAPASPYDLPVYAQPKVDPDHHAQVAKALYSVPGNLIGCRVDARADRALVRISHRGQLVKVHPRMPAGGRSTDPDDLPAEKTVYALREHRGAQAHGRAPRPRHRRLRGGGAGAPAAVDQDVLGLRLLGLVKRWGPEALEARGARALEAEAISVALIGRMIERATEAEPAAMLRRRRPSPPDSPVGPSTSPPPPHPRRRMTASPSCTVLAVRCERAGTGRHRRATSPCCGGSSWAAAPTPCPSAWRWPELNLAHAEFLELLVLADEVTRRETTSADLRARTVGLDPDMRFEHWDEATKVTYDRAVLDELCSLRFVDAGHNAVIMGPVGVGKTFIASALGHAAVRRRYSVVFQRADVMLKRLRASPWTTATTPRCASSCGSTCWSWTTSPSSRWTASTPPTSTTSSSSGTGRPPPWSPPTGSRSSGWARWPTPCWRSRPSTGCSRRPTSWCSTASPTASARSRASTSARRRRALADAGGPRHDHDVQDPGALRPADAARPASRAVVGRAQLHALWARVSADELIAHAQDHAAVAIDGQHGRVP